MKTPHLLLPEGPVLVLAAHPDDEVLGCGGTIARLTDEGREVHIAIFGEGITSRHADPGEADQAALDELHQTALQVATSLGAANLSLFKLPDNRFDTVPLLDIVKPIEGLISEVRPSVVFTQHGGDLNIDHVTLFRATLTATRPMEGMPVRDVYAYEVASSSEWAFDQFEPTFQPSLFVDIEATLMRKVKAMELYESEARPFPHPRSGDALIHAARHTGARVGMKAAEGFHTIRALR